MKNFLKLHKNKILSGGLLFLAALMMLAGLYIWSLKNKPELQVYFFDVGQGDSIFIEAKDGTQILIDGGPTNKILPLLGGVMPFYDHSIDAVVSTHPHADHVSGLIDVLKKYSVGEVIESGASYSTAEAKEFENLVSEKHIKKIII
ncbi:MAG: MBL fold metallo-hydrolase, partial [Candidatus Giovannonibacteria bacterium]|nr:MBL fold metallo-hydrolase [Candidatus Giovannonibacteria bacterium]